jgi:hypothetical protein
MAYTGYLHLLIDLTGAVYRLPGAAGHPDWPQTSLGWRVRPYKNVIQLGTPNQPYQGQLLEGHLYWQGLQIQARQSVSDQAGVVAWVHDGTNEWGLLGCYGEWADLHDGRPHPGVSLALQAQFLSLLRASSQRFKCLDRASLLQQLDRAHLPEE